MIITIIILLCISVILWLVLMFFGFPIFRPKVNHKSEKTRVACVGDSITFGFGVANWKENNYPAQLQKLLGENYIVANFGDCGRTAMKHSSFPYVKSKQFKESLKYKPKIVILMLGTNDTRTNDWKGKDYFKTEYKDLIETYISLHCVEKLYICTPIPAYKNIHKINPYIVEKEVNEAVNELASELNLSLIDTFNAFGGNSQLLFDGVHPNKNGTKILANTIYETLKNDSI